MLPGVYRESTVVWLPGWGQDAPVSESSGTTAAPEKPLSPTGRGTIALRAIRVLHWSGRA